MRGVSSRRRPAGRAGSFRPIRLALTALGIALVVGAIAANQRWLDPPFLPSFFVTRAWYVRAETSVRAVIAIVGVALIAAAGHAGRLLARTLGLAVSIAAAIVAAFGIGELVLRWTPPRPLGWLLANDEPQRQPDARLGWVLTPSRVGHAVVDGHAIDYAIDANGYRVPALEDPVDFAPPTILFVGESVMFGDGLAWDDSVPARVG